MAVREKLPRYSLPLEAELRQQIETELKSPSDIPEPLIVVEYPSPGTIHLFVIWTKFQGYDQTVRSRIILDAFTNVRGTQEALDVTVSMGLTPDEATQMGIVSPDEASRMKTGT